MDIYVSADSLRVYENVRARETITPQTTARGQHPEPVAPIRNPFKVASVCLGMLCVLLLAGNIGLGIQYNRLAENNIKLDKEMEQMIKTYNNLTEMPCSDGWERFGCSCYHISENVQTWEESRLDCLSKGADLVIINSKEEHKFINSFKGTVWIGLTDQETEGIWKWVDGTTLSEENAYWRIGLDGGSKENCAILRSNWVSYEVFGWSDNGWSDKRCQRKYLWICEKKI